LVEVAPGSLQSRGVARALEQSMIEALADCLAHGQARHRIWAERCHETVMRRFRRFFEGRPNCTFYIPEVCVAIGVLERTLRYCCQKHLGMGAKHI